MVSKKPTLAEPMLEYWPHLRALSLALGDTLDMSEVIERSLQQLVALLGPNALVLVETQDGLKGRYLRERSFTDVTCSLYNKADPLVKRYLEEDGIFTLPNPFGEGALTGVFLERKGRRLGLLALGEGAPPDPEVLQALAGEVTAAVARAQHCQGLEARLEAKAGELEEALKKVRRQNAYLEALHDTTLGLISHRDVSDLLHALVTRAGQLIGTSQGFIYLVTPGGDELERKVGVGVFDVDRIPRLKPGEGLSGMVWQTGRTLVTNDYAHWPGRPASISPNLIQAMAGVPLYSGERVVGVLAVAFEGGSGRAFSDDDVALLNSFAELASVALENARLYDSVQREKQYFEALVENSPVAIVTTDLNYRAVSWNPEAERLFGYGENAVLGTNLAELLVPQAQQEEVAAYLRRLEQGERVQAVTQRRREDGSSVEVELLALPVVVAGERVGFIVIYHDITELLRARRDAEAANLAKSQFLANMSHELRTPLNAIIGYSEILREEASELGQEGFIPDLKKINAAGRHLLGLISDILDLSKLEAGSMEVSAQDSDVRALVSELARRVQPLVSEGANSFELVVAPEVHSLHTDASKLQQVLFNLLSNACKFTQGGRIVLEVADAGDALTFTVRDSGIGMSEAQVSGLFKTFSQVDASFTRRYGGAGLGLALSRYLCRLMGGDIHVESEPGRGSSFTVTLPKQAPGKAARGGSDGKNPAD